MASLDYCYRSTARRIERSQGRMIVRALTLPDRPREVWVGLALTSKPQRVRYRQLIREL